MVRKRVGSVEADSPVVTSTTNPNEPQDSLASTDRPSSDVRKRKRDKPEKIEMTELSPPSPTPQGKLIKKAPKFLTTREIGVRYLDRKSYLKLCFREMLIFLVFLIVLGLLASGQHSSSENYLSRVMTKLFVETKFKTWRTSEIINYKEMNTVEHIWEYFNHFMFNTYWEYWYSYTDKIEPTKGEERAVLYENMLIGRPRLRQLRVKSDSCKIPDDFNFMLADCYAEYSSSSEDKSTFGPGNHTSWSFSSSDKLGSLPISGQISTYGGGGFSYDFVPQLVSANDTIMTLYQNLWMNRGTRAVILQFTTYNSNENLFFTLILLMELSPTGGVIPSYKIYVEKFFLRDSWDYVLLVLGGIAVIFILYYTVEEIYELSYFKWHYLDSFWNWLDLTILILGYLTIIFSGYAFMVILYGDTSVSKLIDIKDEHACFDQVNTARDRCITFLAILFFAAAIKMLKYMNFNDSMNQMQTTLSTGTKDIACFSVIFFIVFTTFAQLGHLLFGSQVRDFRTFFHSVFALLRTSVGDFDYHQIENVNHFLGPVFFFTYIFFIYFIFVEMFLAIIVDTYLEVSSNIRDQGKDMQIGDIVLKWLRKIFCCCRKRAGRQERPVPVGDPSAYEDIQNLLRRCGFNKMEIDLFFEKFDIPRDRKLTKEEMHTKLLQNFNMHPDAAQAQSSAPEKAEKDELDESLVLRIKQLENNITEVNYTIDVIDKKIDNIQNQRSRKNTKE